MKLFQIAQIYFAYLGINSSNQSRFFNGKSAVALFIFSLATVMAIVFLFFEAETFLEYTMNFYTIAAVSGCCIAFTGILFKREQLFELIDKFEKLIDASELPHEIRIIIYVF